MMTIIALLAITSMVSANNDTQTSGSDWKDAIISQSLRKANWLRITNCYNPGYAWTCKGTGNNGTDLSSVSNADQLFAFVGDNSDGFIIYSKRLGKEYTLSASNNSNNTAATWQRNAPTPQKWFLIDKYTKDNKTPRFVITTSKTATSGLNMHGGAGGDTKFWDSDDLGSQWKISRVSTKPTIIHFNITGKKKYQDANQWAGKAIIKKGDFACDFYVPTESARRVVKAYLPTGNDSVSIGNYNLHGWKFSHQKRKDEHFVTYTADNETNYQYIAFDNSAQWYRIPAIASASNGDLVAIYDYRVCHGDVGFGEVDQVMRRSSDFGLTWTKQETIADGNGGGKVFGAAYGDPALIGDRESDRMTLVTVSGTTPYPYATATDHNLISVQFSSDNGTTWSQPEDITSQFWGTAESMFTDSETPTDPNVLAYAGFFGSGKILQSRKYKFGDAYRLYAALLARGKGMSGAYVVYSDDMGHNWKLLGGDNSIQCSPNSDEPKVEELPNGDIVLSGRKYNGRYFNIWHWTSEPTIQDTNGKGTWDTQIDSNAKDVAQGIKVGTNSTNGEILFVEAKDAQGQVRKLALQSLPAGNSRELVEIWYKDITSPDAYSSALAFASHWTRGKRVSTEGFSAYSTMCLQKDGKIGFFYEEGPATYCMVYVPLTIEEITGNLYHSIIPEY